MLDKVKRRLVGLTITDVGLVKVDGTHHALLRLSNTEAIYVPWQNVMITDVPIPRPGPARRPASKSLTMNPPGLKIKVG